MHSAILRSPLTASQQLSPLPPRTVPCPGPPPPALPQSTRTIQFQQCFPHNTAQPQSTSDAFCGSSTAKLLDPAGRTWQTQPPWTHMATCPAHWAALPGSLCVPGTGLTGRGTPDLANTCLHALQVDPGPSRGQELLPVPGAQGGCWLGGQGTRLSPPLLPPRELLVKLPPEDAPTKPLLPKFRSALPGARGACA